MDYAGPAGQDLSPRTLPMRVGYRETPWVKNCIAIGLAAGFIEPLESTGIHQVEISLTRIAKIFSRRGDLEQMSKLFRGDTNPMAQGYLDDHPWGTPDEVGEQIKTIATAFGANEVMLGFKYGGMPTDVAERSIRLFADEVLPDLREFHTEPIVQGVAT